MRCLCCNAALTDSEAIAKYDGHPVVYKEMCNLCLAETNPEYDPEYYDDVDFSDPMYDDEGA